MTLPSSGALDFNSIRAEFGSPSSNVYLGLYHRGSAYTTYLPANTSIPTSSTAQTSVNNFYGAEGGSLYAFGTGGAHNTGGKTAAQYYGIGGPSLPAMQNTSIRIGSLNTTMSTFYHSSGALTDFVMQLGTNTYLNSNLTSRLFTAYNTSSSSIGTYRTSSVAGPTGTGAAYSPPSNGQYQYFQDSLQASVAGGTQPTNFTNPGGLNAYFYVKAF
tara:strand:+ start:744 stop:1388 length:645 start_codon:yes stop_codon:yes gene_type:complete